MRGFTVLLHLRDAFEGFEGADQDAAADSGDFRADVEHEVIAIAEIDVGVAAAKEHGAIARGWSPEMVSGGITLWVGLSFDDATAQAAPGEFADDNFADEKAGEGNRVSGEFGAAQASDGNRGLAGQGWLQN